jgi:adenylate kinase
MRLILLGPPGSGKGTQAKLLSQRLGLAHISTGDILRAAVRDNTPAGQRARAFMASGQLVPDELVNEIVSDRFQSADRPEKFVMDGYPRTVPQAVAFDQVLRQQSLGLDAVVLLTVDEEELVKRLSGRWTCPRGTCQASYHAIYRPPRAAGVCDQCGSALVQREDDREETVRRRLQVYHQTTEGLLAHYRGQGLLHEVAGTGEVEQIYDRIQQVLEK